MILITILSKLIQAQTTGMKDVSHVLMDCNEGAKDPSGQNGLSVIVETLRLFTLQRSQELSLSENSFTLQRERENTELFISVHIFKVTAHLFFYNLACEERPCCGAELFTVCCDLFIFYAVHGTLKERSDNRRACCLLLYTCTHFLGERILVYITLHSQGHSHECMHALTCTITRIHWFLSQFVLPSPSRTAFTSDCQLFGSEPSLITQILHPVSPLCIETSLLS